MPEINNPNSPQPADPAALQAFRVQALRYLDGLHTDGEARQFGEQLSSSAEFRDYFAALCVESGILHEMLLPTSPDDEEVASPFDRAGAMAFGTELRQRAESRKSRFLSSRGKLFAVAAGLFVAALGAWMLRTISRNEPHPIIASGNDAVPAIYGTRLDSGTTRFTLPNVGYVIAEGPAEFNLLSPMRARLNSGRIKMRVTEVSGHGFVVETPYGEVTDLGTEFGLDVSQRDKAGLVVFEGQVDLRVAEQKKESSTLSRVERLVGGDGVTFDRVGQLDRIMSIVTGKSATFRSGSESHDEDSEPLIADITDNLRASDTKRFYEIVRGGFGEDARAFVDRAYEWNALDEGGLPSFLVGADYILPFNEDKEKRLQITLTLARPATVYILFDDRGTPPKWLTSAFDHTGFEVGMDEDQGPPGYNRPFLKIGRGAANSIDYTFSVWKHDVPAPGKIELGSREGPKGSRSMYGIVVVPLKAARAELPNAL